MEEFEVEVKTEDPLDNVQPLEDEEELLDHDPIETLAFVTSDIETSGNQPVNVAKKSRKKRGKRKATALDTDEWDSASKRQDRRRKRSTKTTDMEGEEESLNRVPVETFTFITSDIETPGNQPVSVAKKERKKRGKRKATALYTDQERDMAGKRQDRRRKRMAK